MKVDNAFPGEVFFRQRTESMPINYLYRQRNSSICCLLLLQCLLERRESCAACQPSFTLQERISPERSDIGE